MASPRLVLGVSSGQPLMDSLGYGAAMLVPVAAWYARSALTADLPARACLVADAGSAGVQLASLVVALTASVVLAVIGVLVSGW